MHELAGHGMEAINGGQEVLVGNIRLMTERRISIPEELSDQVATVVICAIDKKYAGHLLLSDTLKDDAVEAIAKLRKFGGTDIRLLSGDKKEIVESFAKRLDIDLAYGNLLPEDKVTHIREMVEEPGKSVAFVGDGMNDAPVLALSHVGIAMGDSVRMQRSRVPTALSRTTSRPKSQRLSLSVARHVHLAVRKS